MTDINTKCDSYFIPKCNRNLLQNVLGFSLQMQQVYYKIEQLLPKFEDLITRCDSYYRMWC